MQIYKINLPFSTPTAPSLVFKPVYFTSSTGFPYHQLKFYSLLNHKLPENLDFQRNFTVLFETKAIAVEHTDFLDEDEGFPLDSCQENVYFQGKTALKAGKFAEAFAFFVEGVHKLHGKSLAQVLRLSLEDHFKGNLQGKSPNLEEILEKLVENWKINGLFEVFDAQAPKTLLLQQFFTYQDLFPAFRAAISLKSLTNPLISLVNEPNYEKLQRFKANTPNFRDFSLVVADFLNPCLLGVGIYADFKEIQELYTENLKENARIWLRLLVITCEFLKSQREMQRILGKVKEIDPILARNLAIAEENVKIHQEIASSYEFSRYCFEKTLGNLLDEGNLSTKGLEILWKNLKEMLCFGKSYFYEAFATVKTLEKTHGFGKYREFLAKIAENKENACFLQAFVEKRAEFLNENQRNRVFLLIVSAFLQEDDVFNEISLHSFYKIAKSLRNPQFSQCFQGVLCAVSVDKPVFSAFLLAKAYKSGVFAVDEAEIQQKVAQLQGLLGDFCENPGFRPRNLVELLIKSRLKGAKSTEIAGNPGNLQEFMREMRECWEKTGFSWRNSLEKAKEIASKALKGEKPLENPRKSRESQEKLRYFELLQAISYSDSAAFFDFVKELLEKSLFCFEKHEVSRESAGNSTISRGFLAKSAQKCYVKSHSLHYFAKNAAKTSSFLGKLLKSLDFQGDFLVKPFGFCLETHEKQGFLELWLLYEDFGALFPRKRAVSEEFIGKFVDFLVFFEKNHAFLPYFSEKNWVFSETGEIFFADWDFFLVKSGDFLEKARESQENVEFWPPELIKSVFLDKSSDFPTNKGSFYWSFGVLLYNWLANEAFPFRKPAIAQDFHAFYNEKSVEGLITQKVKEKAWWIILKSLLHVNSKERHAISLETLVISMKKAANPRKTSEKPRFSAKDQENPLFFLPKLQKTKAFLRNKAVFAGSFVENRAFEGSLTDKALSFKGKLENGRFRQGELLDLEKGLAFQGEFLDNFANFPCKGVFSRLSLTESREIAIKNANYLAETIDFESFEGNFETFHKSLPVFLRKHAAKYVESLNFPTRKAGVSLKSCLEQRDFLEKPGFLLINRETIATKLLVFLPEVSKTHVVSLEVFKIGVFLLANDFSASNPWAFSLEVLEGVRFSLFGCREAGLFAQMRLIKGNCAENSAEQSFVDLTKDAFFAKIQGKTHIFEGFLGISGKQGLGTELFIEKDEVFCGEFAKNQRFGRGFLANSQGNVLAKGLFVDGVLDFGTVFRKDAVFHGKFSEFHGETCCFGSVKTGKFEVFCENEAFSLETAAPASFKGEVRVVFPKLGWEYKGFFVNGVRKGFGVLQVKSLVNSQRTCVFQGIWKDKQLLGTRFYEKNEKKLREIGKFTLFPSQKVLLNGFSRVFYANSEVFEGVVANNFKTFGGISCENREYFGSFLNDRAEGFGIQRFFQGKCRYSGFFKAGQPHKLGVWRDLQGKKVIFEGISLENWRVFGSFYVDVAKISSFSGKCHVKLQENGVTLQPEGFGVVYLRGNIAVECDLSALNPLFFNGESFSFVENAHKSLKTFKATVNFPDERVFEGEIRDWEMHGVGFLKGNRGKLYEGELFQGNYEGFGRVFASECEIYQGFLRNNQRNGVGKAIDLRDMKEMIGVWKQGDLERNLCICDRKGNKLIKIEKFL